MGPVYKSRVGEFVNLPVTRLTTRLQRDLVKTGRYADPCTRSETRNSQKQKKTNLTAQMNFTFQYRYLKKLGLFLVLSVCENVSVSYCRSFISRDHSKICKRALSEKSLYRFPVKMFLQRKMFVNTVQNVTYTVNPQRVPYYYPLRYHSLCVSG